jgi:hypothetical protein
MLDHGVVQPLAAAFLGAQALAVLVFAAWEYAGMRASSGMRPLTPLRV